MARLSDPNEKAPQEPTGPGKNEPIPKEGITAGDLAMQQIPDPQKDPYGYMIFIMEKGFESVHKRINQQGELLANMAEKVYGPQASTASAPVTGSGLGALFSGDNIGKFLDLAKENFGGGPDRIYTDIGKRVVEGATDTAIKSIIRNVGREAAGSITHVG